MATNGNEQTSNQGTNQQLAAALRDMQTVQPAGSKEQEIYDLVSRVNDTARAIRDLAGYSNHIADDLERMTASYVGHMQRLLGQIGRR
jgi:hypothetical protein